MTFCSPAQPTPSAAPAVACEPSIAETPSPLPASPHPSSAAPSAHHAKAHLALVGSDDPLEAGLEIYARPAGKNLAMLSLLSGGEQALTALSLIFAVFRCNPAPVCALDEVDAPFDDAKWSGSARCWRTWCARPRHGSWW